MTAPTTLSVLVPAYNEQYLVYASLERLGILSSQSSESHAKDTTQSVIRTQLPGTIFSASTWMWERLDAMIFGYLYASAACTALPREQSPPRGRTRFAEIARVYVDLLRSSPL